ncbi:HD domain-containing protein [Rummeliibacillus pycnus]|uniref:HD domain-containing protein n=1 Tax=Rummeliibacillus pycnus TaxID=101070 RepID=UPI0037C7498F
MRIIDKIYGDFCIDGVLEQLILSSPIRRLKGIYQGGASYLVNEKWNVTRYDHSIGVMLLIKKLGGSIEEQIAGLLHDVSHTAFSHVIDFVLENREEDYHEKIYEAIVKKSEIPNILSKYGYNYQHILIEDSKWNLLERPAPELCADRVDYTLRDMYQYGQISIEEIQHFLENLIIIDGKLAVKNIETAEWFVQTYYKEVIDFFMEPLNIYAYDFLAKALKIALNKNIITLDTLLGTDAIVMNQLRTNQDDELLAFVKHVHRNVIVKEDKNNFDLHRRNKLRIVDPSVLRGNELIRASKLSENIKKMGKAARKKAEEGMFVKIISN